MEAQNKRKAEEDKKKQEQQAKKDAEAKVCLLGTMGEKKTKKKKEQFTLSSDHSGSLLRRQPGAAQCDINVEPCSNLVIAMSKLHPGLFRFAQFVFGLTCFDEMTVMLISLKTGYVNYMFVRSYLHTHTHFKVAINRTAVVLVLLKCGCGDLFGHDSVLIYCSKKKAKRAL